VVGGGNTALEDAIYLSPICGTVHLIHRRDTFRGGQILVDRVLALPNVQVHYDTVTEAIIGDGKVVGINLKNVKTGVEGKIAVSGIFIAAGTEPDNSRFVPLVQLDPAGYILAGEDCETGTPGVYAAGDTRQKQLRQIITAASDGAVAATLAIQHMG